MNRRALIGFKIQKVKEILTNVKNVVTSLEWNALINLKVVTSSEVFMNETEEISRDCFSV